MCECAQYLLTSIKPCETAIYSAEFVGSIEMQYLPE